MMVMRDLLAPREAGPAPGSGRLSGRNAKRRPLRRKITVFDLPPARGPIERLDQSFDRLVLESGHDMIPMTVFLMLLSSGLFVGGCIWLYYDQPLSGIAGGLMGMLVPLVVLTVHRGRRMRAIREQLPHVIDMISRAVHAGESVDQAIDLVGKEAGGVIGQEFARCARELELGRSFSSSLQSLAARVRLVEIRILATTLIVQRQSGGNLAETLERMSAVIRDRLTAYRQMRAATGAGRAATILIAVVSPAAYLFMFAFQPEHVSVLYTETIGRLMLITALVLEIVGVLWVVSLVRHDH